MPILEEQFDEAIRNDSLVWGTYLHRVFDDPTFRRAWLNRVCLRKGFPLLESHSQPS